MFSRCRFFPFGAVLVLLTSMAASCRQVHSGGALRPAAFDWAAAARPGDLAARVALFDGAAAPGGRVPLAIATVEVEEISFQSTEWDPDGGIRPIRIHGYLARRVGTTTPKPVVVLAHGLGGEGDPAVAQDLARNLDVVAVAISGPGAGRSEGAGITADDARRLFATVPDVRGSWLYAYTFALMRAVTYAGTRPEVDPRAVVVAGVSLGGVVSLIANGVDARIGGVLVMNASGGLHAAAAAGSWLRNLVTASGGLTLEDRSVTAMMRALDPLGFADRQHGAVFLLVGAQDQFFPIDQVVRTYRALRAPVTSLALVADFDHQWYFGAGCPARCMPGGPHPVAPSCAEEICPATCPAGARWPYCGPQASYNRQQEALDRWNLLLRALVARVANPRRPFGPPPPEPTVERREREVLVHVAGPLPRAVRLAVSDNGGYTFGQFRAEPDPGTRGLYRLSRPVSRGAIVFAEVEAADGTVATSVPDLPPGFAPIIRPFAQIAP